MNIIFLIGNGFDMNVGLKTSYKDFLNYYCDIYNDDQKINEFKKQINCNKELWSDFENRLGQYTNDVPDEDTFFSNMRNFKEELMKYLEAEQNKIDFEASKEGLIDKYTNSIVNFMNFLEAGQAQIIRNLLFNNANTSHNYKFISFNYTNVLDKCIDLLNLKKPFCTHVVKGTSYNDYLYSPIHVHGTTGKRPLMGLNDISQIANESFKTSDKFIKNYIKPETNKRTRQLLDDKAIEIIIESDIICVFGMSIGETDAFWWELISKWLLGATHRQLVIYAKVRNWNLLHTELEYEKEEELKARFFANAGIDDNEKIKAIIERIHVSIIANHGIFSADFKTVDQSTDEIAEEKQFETVNT